MAKHRTSTLVLCITLLLLVFSFLSTAQEDEPGTPPPDTDTPTPIEMPTSTLVVPTLAPTNELPTPTAAPTNEPLPTPTAAPTDELLPTPTAAPTDELLPTPTVAPTDELLPTPTVAPTDDLLPTPTAAPTDDLLPTPTAAPTDELLPTPTSTPSNLNLVFSTDFETPAPELSLQGWIPVSIEGGSALQSGSEASVIIYNTAYQDAALRIRALINQGALSLTLRQNSLTSRPNTDMSYVFTLNHEGVLKLLRSGQEVASTLITLIPGEWITLEAQAVEGVLSASVDGMVVLSYLDAEPLPLGSLSVSSSASALIRVDDLAIWARGEGAEQIALTPDDATGQAHLSWGQTVATCHNPGTSATHTFYFNNNYPLYIIDLMRISGNLRFNVHITGPGINRVIPSSPAGELIIYGPDHGGGAAGHYSMTITGTSGSGCVNATIWSWYRPQNQIGWGWRSTDHSLRKWRYNTGGAHHIRIERMEGEGPLNATIWTPNGLRFDVQSQTGVLVFDHDGPWGEYNVEIHAHNGAYRWIVNSGLAHLELPTNLRATNITHNSATLHWVDNSHGEQEYVVGLLDLGFDVVLPPDTTSYTFTGLSCGTTYRAFVGPGISSRGISGVIHLLTTRPCPPANDEPDGALVMSSISYPDTRETQNVGTATRSANDPTICVPNYNHSVWYRWTSNVTRAVWANTHGSTFDTVLAVLDESGNVIACNNDEPSSLFSSLSFNAAIGRTYYLMIASFGSGDITLSSVAQLNISTVAAPVLSSPQHGAHINTGRPTLAALAAPGAAYYRFDLTTDDSIVLWNVFSRTPSLSLSPAVLPTPLAPGRYHWRVQVCQLDTVCSTKSATRSFVVNPLTGPTNNAVFFTPARHAVRFGWVGNGIPGTFYTIQVADNYYFDNIIFERTTTALGYAMTAAEALPHGVYWVRLLVNGEVLPSETAVRFVVSPPAPPAPVLTGPANGLITNNRTPTFQWTAPNYAFPPLTYEIQVDNNADFSSPEYVQVDIGALSTTTTALADSRYNVRVRAVNQYGVPGAWSVVRAFTVDTIPPNAPNLLQPFDGASLTTLTPILSWSTSVGAVRHEVEFSHDSSFSRPVRIAVTAARLVVPGPLNNAAYWWRARSFDAAGNVSAWSSPRSFTARSLPSAVPTLCRTAAPNLTLSWERVSWAQAYQIQISLSPNFDINLENYVVGASTTSFTTGTLGNARYFWRVRAQNSAGGWGSWSTTVSCSVAAS